MSSGYNSSSSGSNYHSSHDFPSSSSPSGPSIPIISDPRAADSFKSWLMPTTETTLRILKQYLESYRHYVAQNPVWISEVESALYWVSYLLSSINKSLMSVLAHANDCFSFQQLGSTTRELYLSFCIHVPHC